MQVASGRRDTRFAVAIATVLVVLLAVGPFLLRPWGPATPTTRDLASFWTDVPLVIDFISFWTGGSLAREGVGPLLYDMETQRAFQSELRQRVASHEELRRFTVHAPFVSSPPVALLFLPFSYLPISWAYLTWSAASLLLAWLAVSLPLRGRPMARTRAMLALSYIGAIDTLVWGQLDALLLAALSLGMVALASGRPVLGGVLLGLLWLKPQQALLVTIVLLLKRRWRELAGVAMAGAAMAVASLALVGFSGLLHYAQLLRKLGGFYPPPGVVISPDRMANWRGALMHLWPGVPEGTGSTLVLLLGAATVLLSLLAWRGRWDPTSPRFGWQMLALVLATLVASPHTHFHSTILLLGPLAICQTGRTMSASGGQLSPLRVWPFLLLVGYILSLALWPFRTAFWLLVPYYLVVMGLAVWWSWPRGTQGKSGDLRGTRRNSGEVGGPQGNSEELRGSRGVSGGLVIVEGGGPEVPVVGAASGSHCVTSSPVCGRCQPRGEPAGLKRRSPAGCVLGAWGLCRPASSPEFP